MLLAENLNLFGQQGWHSGESTRLQPMFPGFAPGLGVIWVNFDLNMIIFYNSYKISTERG